MSTLWSAPDLAAESLVKTCSTTSIAMDSLPLQLPRNLHQLPRSRLRQHLLQRQRLRQHPHRLQLLRLHLVRQWCLGNAIRSFRCPRFVVSLARTW